MRKIIFLVSFSCVLQFGFAQEFRHFNLSQADSLKKELVKHSKDDSVRAYNLIAIGSAYSSTNPALAETYGQQGLALSVKIKWVTGIVSAYQQLGSIALNTSSYIKALDYYQKSLSAAEALKDKTVTAQLKTNIAMIYLQSGDYDKAISIYKEAISIMHEQKETYLESVSLLNLGLAYFRKNDFSDAILYFDKGLGIAQKYNYPQVSAYCLCNKGAAYNQTGKFDSALIAFNKSIEHSDVAGDSVIKSESLNGIAESNLYLKKYSEAQKYLNRSLAISKPLSLLQYQRESYQMLSDIYKEQKKYKESLETYKEFITLRDSIINEDKKSEITRMEMQYQFDKQHALNKATADKKQALAAAEINRQKVIRNASIGIGALLILMAIAGIVLYKRRKDIIEKRKESEFKAQVADTEMKALRAQMNPHFIFNSLNSINNYISKNEPKQATEYLNKFAKVMRLILENSEKKSISLADELKSLELYMQLESRRLDNKFNYTIKIADDIDAENTLVPPMILQPFVENSIWHGITNKEGKGNILIDISKNSQMLRCIIDDDGVGRQKTEAINKAKNHLSLGMKITKARIDIINKTKSTEGNVELFDLTKGMRVRLNLPFELSF